MERLYDYQKDVAQTLRAGQSIVLQAPTGAGKTFAALWPFLEAWDRNDPTLFPTQCIYSAPMRVLTGQFEREAMKIVGRMRLADLPEIKTQTGEFPDDPQFLGDLIFATLDQTLSSALSVPYSLSRGQSNMNVGAILGSYLVFDEFHLFPHQAAITTLQLLRTVGKIAPFVLMTATFTQTMLNEIETLLGAKLTKVSEEEVEHIETAWGKQPRKERLYRIVDRGINPEYICKAHQQRSLAVCNTVDRAIDLYKGLLRKGCRPVPFDQLITGDLYENLRNTSKPLDRQKAGQKVVDCLYNYLKENPGDSPWVMLLHSRFERPHRQAKEQLLQALWGKDSLHNNEVPSMIVVATQVVEVGLDISSQILHTELSPAASVFQRAGRCARNPGERGTVYVYQVPEDKNGNPNYAPYGQSNLEKQVCELTWKALRACNNSILFFKDEQEIINSVHADSDRNIIEEMKQNEAQIWMRIGDALTQADVSTRQDLIRNSIENRTLLVYEPPRGPTEDNPYRLEGFSLWQGTLRGRLRELKDLKDELKLDWALRYPKVREGEKEEGIPTAYYWLDVNLDEGKAAQKEISASLIFAVHPQLAAYDAQCGFRLSERSDGLYRSPPAVHSRVRPDYGSYRLESYSQHIAQMRRVFERGPLQRRLAWVGRRLAEQAIPPGLLENAVRLAFALHDLGKLDVRWQKWAAEYQEAIGEGPPNFLVAHTHWEEDNNQHKEAQKKVKNKKPKTHAGEGADAGVRILYEGLNAKQNPGLYKATFTAIARHHSPFLESAYPYRLHEKAQATMVEALISANIQPAQSLATWLQDSTEDPDLLKRLLEPYPDAPLLWWWLYFLIVRNLRLCDGMSQEI